MKTTDEVLRVKVTRAFNEYKNYVECANTQNKLKHEVKKKITELYKEDKDDPEVIDFTFDVYMIDAFHKRDITLLGTTFVNYLRLYKEVPDVKPFSEEIESTYSYLDKIQLEQGFIVEQGKFKELRKGFIDERRKIFDENNIFETVKKDLEKQLV